jgi:hypothetical protein
MEIQLIENFLSNFDSSGDMNIININLRSVMKCPMNCKMRPVVLICQTNYIFILF